MKRLVAWTADGSGNLYVRNERASSGEWRALFPRPTRSSAARGSIVCPPGGGLILAGNSSSQFSVLDRVTRRWTDTNGPDNDPFTKGAWCSSDTLALFGEPTDHGDGYLQYWDGAAWGYISPGPPAANCVVGFAADDIWSAEDTHLWHLEGGDWVDYIDDINAEMLPVWDNPTAGYNGTAHIQTIYAIGSVLYVVVRTWWCTSLNNDGWYDCQVMKYSDSAWSFVSTPMRWGVFDTYKRIKWLWGEADGYLYGAGVSLDYPGSWRYRLFVARQNPDDPTGDWSETYSDTVGSDITFFYTDSAVAQQPFCGDGRGNIWFACNNGYSFRTLDHGETWEYEQNPWGRVFSCVSAETVLDKDSISQYRPGVALEGKSDAEAGVRQIVTAARNINNYVMYAGRPKLISEIFPDPVLSPQSTTETVVLPPFAVAVPRAYDKVMFHLRHYRSAGSDSTTWRLYAAENMYAGPNEFDIGMIAGSQVGTVTTSSDTAEITTSHTSLGAARKKDDVVWFVVTAEDGDGSTQSAITQIDVYGCP